MIKGKKADTHIYSYRVITFVLIFKFILIVFLERKSQPKVLKGVVFFIYSINEVLLRRIPLDID